MDYNAVDVIVVLDNNGNVDGVYDRSGTLRVAVVDHHWDDQDKIWPALQFGAMSREDKDKFKAMIDAERRHYHIGNMDRGDFRLYKELDQTMTDLQECLEEAEHKSNFAVYACVDDCEGIG